MTLKCDRMNEYNKKEWDFMKWIKTILPYAIIAIVVILIRSFVVTPVMVDGDSMKNTLHHKDILLLKKYDHSYNRGDIIVFNYNDDKLIKRIIGLPGERVSYEDGILYINDEVVEDTFASITEDFSMKRLGIDFIPEGYYFVLGDNRGYSSDSRVIGLVSKNEIEGITNFSLWPFKNIK